jgi:transposase
VKQRELRHAPSGIVFAPRRDMAWRLVDDELWTIFEAVLPKHSPSEWGGRPRTPDRAALTGIVYVLRTGIPWKYVPMEFGCTGMTCWNRLREWQCSGVFDQVLEVLLVRLHRTGKLDWSRAVIDSAQVPAKRGGGKTGPNPTDRGRSGSKHHLITDRKGTPLATPLLTASNVPDVVMLIPLVDHVSPIHGQVGRPRRRPDKLHADKGYASRANRRALRQRGIQPRIARKGIESSARLGRHRWVVERSFAWLHRFRRLFPRYERDPEIHQGFMNLAAILICWSVLTS